MGKKKKQKKKGSKKRKASWDLVPSPASKNFSSDHLPESEQYLTIVNYQVTSEPLQKYSRKIQDQIEDLYDLIFSDPSSAIEKLSHLIEEHPHIPVFLNFLSVAYQELGDKEKSKYWCEENYRRHPDYLFAKINLAAVYLEDRELGKFEELFDGKYDLSLLYPRRKLFHVTEMVGFFGVVGKYYWLTNKRDPAKVCYNILKQLEPDHPHTLFLGRKLYPFVSLFSFRTIKSIFAKIFALIIIILMSPLLLLIGITQIFRRQEKGE